MTASGSTVAAMAVLLVPPVFALVDQWITGRPWGRGIRAAMYSVTMIVVSGVAALHTGLLPEWAAHLAVRTLRLEPTLGSVFRLFLFAVWFGLSIRLLVVSRASDAVSRPAARQRSARLTSRVLSQRIPRASWLFAWTLWGYGATVTMILAATAERLVNLGTAVVLELVGLALVLGSARAVQAISYDPEPLDLAGSRELADAYAVHRSVKAATYYWLTLALVMWLAVAANVALAVDDPSAMVIGVLESSALVIAISGVVAGIGLSTARAGIQRTLDGAIAARPSA